MRAFLLYIFIFLFCVVEGQEVKISGYLKDLDNTSAISNATLSSENKQISVSDSSGYFSFKIESNERIIIQLLHPDYRRYSQVLTSNKDSVLTIFVASRFQKLGEITVTIQKENSFGVSRMNNIDGTTIYAGKKSEAIYLQDLNANLAANNSRQVFSKIPGINVFENDGSGATIGIGGRGLNPNRISNFNTRQNGYDISADALGYPESYYTPPTEAVERIEILRGAAGLQFGTQFGGMINYKFAEASPKKFSGDFRQTGGSYGFLNSFNRVSGTKGKFSYNIFYQYKHYTGWRARSELNSHTAFASFVYRVNSRLKLRTEFTHMNYLAQQPGGLTDKQFADDPSKIYRFRNWFRVNWNLASLSADFQLNERTKMSFISFGLLAGRDALGVLGRVERSDDTTANRNLLSDQYKNYGAELRLLHRYRLGQHNSHWLIGARLYKGQTTRKQGDASKSNLPEFDFLHPDDLENSAYRFPSTNYALFIENIFQITKRWVVIPGLRCEYINTASEGYYTLTSRDLSNNIFFRKRIDDTRSLGRSFLLGGIGTQYKLSSKTEIYANISQNYRSINFNDMRVTNSNFQVDTKLKDESGFTTDGGFRGSWKDLLYFDLGVFMIQYNNRIGTALMLDTNTFQLIRYRTNLGSSISKGIEFFGELDWLKLFRKKQLARLSTFINLSLIDARYISKDIAYNNKKVEYVPKIIFRTGITFAIKKFSATLQYSYTDRQFSDATNAPISSSGLYGLIPRYQIIDLNLNYTFKKVGIVAGVNNLGNSVYFTRRAEGYPGPGIIPADPINVYTTIRYQF